MKHKAENKNFRWKNAFSILLRIVRGETPQEACKNLQAPVFQYPLTDRAGWNKFINQERIIAQLLSVSSYGSCGVKPWGTAVIPTQELRFQYPLTDRAGWNGLSRSPNISRHKIFQYPLTDRAGWNYTLHYGCVYWNIAFSILLRIVRGETVLTTIRGIQRWIFQYPLTDRAGWNELERLWSDLQSQTFSILLRIVRGETPPLPRL